MEDGINEVEVDYVDEVCRRCGNMEHYARECPTPKGDGTREDNGEGQRGMTTGKD